MYRSIERARVTYEREHGGNGGFAVAARNADNVLIMLGKLPKRHGTLKLRNVMRRAVGTLHIVGLDGGGINDKIRISHVIFFMADCHRHAKLLQAFGKRRSRSVGTLHLIAARHQNLGEAVHGAAADADEVDFFVFADMRHRPSKQKSKQSAFVPHHTVPIKRHKNRAPKARTSLSKSSLCHFSMRSF